MTPSAGVRPSRAQVWWSLAALVGGGMALGLGGLFVRLADTGPVSTAFWRLLLALPFMMALAGFNDGSPRHLPRRPMLLVMLGGIAFATDLSLWHVGLGMTRLANATLFGNAASFVLMVWGFLAVRAWPDRQEWLAMVLAVAGAAILMGRSLQVSTATLFGDFFALGAGLVYALYLLMLRSARSHLGSWTVLALVSLAACPCLLLIANLLDESVWPHRWGPLLTLALVCQVGGQGLLVFAMRRVSPLMLGLGLLVQPAVAATSGAWWLGESLELADVLGMLFVAGAITLSATRQARET